MTNLYVYGMIFFSYSFLGWIIEVTSNLIENKRFVNRGFLFGPYIPIFGYGGLLITLLLEKYQGDPFVLFISSMIICGILEYLTSLIMEKIFKARWWDYSKKKFNINGRICLEVLVIFGFLGYLVITFINPFLYNTLILSNNYSVIVFIVLTWIYLIDTLFSLKIAFDIKGLIPSIKEDNTIEINKIIKQKLKNLRIIKSFPNLNFFNNKAKDK